MKAQDIVAILNVVLGPGIILVCIIAALTTLGVDQKASILSAALAAGGTMTNSVISSRNSNGRKDDDDNRGSGRFQEGEVSRYSDEP